MSKHTLSVERLKEVLNYDPVTGIFTYRIRRSNVSAGSPAGHMHNKGYHRISIDDKRHYASRLAWFYMTGEWPSEHIDHINGDRSDNRFENLRLATAGENQQNRSTPRNSTTGFLGVTWNKGMKKFQAQITSNWRHYRLGYFDTPEEAHAAYLAAKQRLHTFQPVPRDLPRPGASS